MKTPSITFANNWKSTIIAAQSIAKRFARHSNHAAARVIMQRGRFQNESGQTWALKNISLGGLP
jgi:hypothetical protein